MSASTSTTIRGVSIFSRQRQRKADVFDIALSPEGIAIQRPGRSDQRMTWERITQWEIEERSGYLVLTLRGGGSVTPLLVKGWTLEDLERLMRETTTGTATEPESASAAASVPQPKPVPESEAVTPAAPPVPRAARRAPRRSVGKVLVTVVLLGLLATAVALVLLQSAGVISWGFLGPTS
jgi:hypothetical protein